MISVVVPIYNKEKYLKKCIESILTQTYKDIELILVDDGSKDDSLKICKEYETDKRVKIISKKNGGVSAARNIGVENASGDKIVFIDADDYVDKDYINNLAKYDDDLVVCGYLSDNNSSISKEGSYNELLISKIAINKNILNKKYIKLLVTPYLKLFKKNIIDNNAIRFNEKMSFGEDACFVFNYINSCESVRFIGYCGYYNVIIEGTLSRKYINNIEEQLELLNDEINKIDGPKDMKDYWVFRNYKLVLFNEKNSNYKTFKNKLKLYQKLNINNKFFSKADKVILTLLNNKLYYVIYVIYKYIK